MLMRTAGGTMHELSVIMAVVDAVDEYLDAACGPPSGGRSPAAAVTRVTLQVGDRSSYVPSCLREIWPFAVNETSLENAALEIEDVCGTDLLIKGIEIEE
jgi:Zn finger protein HypA/HybF involved in hydrogenase expression